MRIFLLVFSAFFIACGSGSSGSHSDVTEDTTPYLPPYDIDEDACDPWDEQCVEHICRALEFDGAHDYVSVEGDSDLNLALGPFTVEAWAYLDSYTSLNVSPIISKVSMDEAGSHGWSLWIAGAGTTAGYEPGMPLFNLLYADGSGCSVSDTGVVVPTGTWFHIAVTYDDPTDTVTLWLDGVEVSNSMCSPPPSSNSGPLLMGMYRPLADCGSRCRCWNGLLDETRVSSAVRYAANFDPESHLLGDSDTVALWHYDEGTGDTVFDTSGNGRDGTIYTVYGPSWVDDGPQCEEAQ